MVIVLFEATLKNGKMEDYLAQAADFKSALSETEGFIRSERFSSLSVEGKLLRSYTMSERQVAPADSNEFFGG